MVTYRNIRVRMKGGKSRIQRALVLASGKLRFVKNVSTSRSAAPRHTTTKHRSVRSMARRKGRHVSRGSLVRSVEKMLTGASLLAPAAISLKERGMNAEGAKAILHKYTGINADAGTWEPHMLVQGWGPYVGFKVGSKLVHKVIGLVSRF